MTYDPIDTSATDNAADGSVTTDTLDSTTLNNSGTVTTQDLVVNGTATGPFGGGGSGVVLEPGDTITVALIDFDTSNGVFQTLYSGTAKDVLGGVVSGRAGCNFLYTFSDGSTLNKNAPGTTNFGIGNDSRHRDKGGDSAEIDFLPPALNVVKIEVGNFDGSSNEGESAMGAEVLLKD